MNDGQQQFEVKNYEQAKESFAESGKCLIELYKITKDDEKFNAIVKEQFESALKKGENCKT